MFTCWSHPSPLTVWHSSSPSQEQYTVLRALACRGPLCLAKLFLPTSPQTLSPRFNLILMNRGQILATAWTNLGTWESLRDCTVPITATEKILFLSNRLFSCSWLCQWVSSRPVTHDYWKEVRKSFSQALRQHEIYEANTCWGIKRNVSKVLCERKEVESRYLHR